MTLDIIIGNPPYNSDMYLPFILNLESIYDEYMSFVTPSKWQGKGKEINVRFRNNILPYMSTIVYYTDCRDIFGLTISNGASYYLIDKDIHKIKHIINRSIAQPLFNNEQYREIEGDAILNNIGNDIVKKVKALTTDYISHISTDRTYWVKEGIRLEKEEFKGSIKVYGGDTVGEKLLYGYCDRDSIDKHRDDIDRYKVIMQFKQGHGYFDINTDGTTNGIKPNNIYYPGEICKNDYMVLYIADTLEECKYYKSYIDTKFIRFLLFCGCVGENASNVETWRFIPYQEKYDHIFTDEELYKKYKLTSDEVELIEKFIRKRK